jgi:hypothetical protein
MNVYHRLSFTTAANHCPGLSVIAGVADTGNRVEDTSEQLTPVTTTPTINLSPVTTTPMNNYCW